MRNSRVTRASRILALLLAVCALQAVPVAAHATGGSTYRAWLQGCNGTFSSGACWDGGVPDSTSIATIASTVDGGGSCRSAVPIVTKDVTVGGLMFDQGCGADAGLAVDDSANPATVTVTQTMNWGYGSAMDPKIEIAGGATAVISYWPHRRVITSDWTISGTLEMIAAGLGDDDLRAYGAVLTVTPSGTVNVIGDSGLSSDCCLPPQSGLHNQGTLNLVAGSDLTLDTGFDSSGTVDVPEDSVLTLEYPGDLGPTTFSGGGLVDIVDTNNPGWDSDPRDFPEPRVYGSITLTGDVTLEEGTVMQVEQTAEVAGIGNILGSGTLRLGGSWYARSELGPDITLETIPGDRARISSWDGKHDGLISRLTLGSDTTIAPGSLLSVETAVDTGSAYGLSGGLVVPKKITLTVPDGAVLGTNGCCLSGAQVVVDGRMVVGGGDGGERYGTDWGDDQPGDDPALLSGIDLGGAGTINASGITEWDLDPGHHFTGLFQLGGTIKGDLPIADANLYPVGPLSVTERLTIGDLGSMITVISPSGATNQVSVGGRAYLAGELRATITEAIPQGTVSTPLVCLTDGCRWDSFATNPDATDWEVGYTDESVTLTRISPLPMPASWITAWPKSRGVHRVGQTLRAEEPSYSAAARQHDAHAGFVWSAGSKVVSRTASLHLTRQLRGKKITLEVTVSATGYTNRSKSIGYGKVR